MLADVARLDLREDEVAALERSAEGCSRVSVVAQGAPIPRAGQAEATACGGVG